MRIIALYVDGRRYVLDDSAAILSRANQALATLERYKLRLDEVAGTLSALEIEDLVTVRDATAVAQRLEMVRRIAAEIEGYVVELGTDGRLLSLQLDELIAGRRARARADRPRLPATRRAAGAARTVDEALAELDELVGAPTCSTSRPSPGRWATARSPTRWTRRCQPARLPAAGQGAAAAAAPSSTGWSSTSAGCRSCWPRASTTCRPSRASARPGPASVREGLSRLAESSILERYV